MKKVIIGGLLLMGAWVASAGAELEFPIYCWTYMRFEEQTRPLEQIVKDWKDLGITHPLMPGVNGKTNNPAGKALVAPVLEGGAAFLMLSSEALCQGWGGEIRLFPSVPDGFTGHFENFRVRGGYTVSASMRDGKVVDCRIDGAKEGEFERVAENRFVRRKQK